MNRPSAFATAETCEGCYVRVESDEVVLDRFKMRRNTFKPGESWKEEKNNKLRDS